MAFKINKTKEYAILYLHRITGMPVDEVAKVLNISVSSVQQALDDNPEEKVQNNNFIRETSQKRTRNVAIMTKEGSASGDDITADNITHRQSIFKPRG